MTGTGSTNRKVAIIGGAGFIGHHLALTLAERGTCVEIIDSLQVNNVFSYMKKDPSLHETVAVHSTRKYLNILHSRIELLHEANIPLHVLDARDYYALNRILQDMKPQVVIHLAAVAHAGRSNKDPYSTFDHSLRTLENTLDWSRGNTDHFIFFSSSMVYGNFLSPKVDEEHPLEPLGIYGALKLAGEKIVIAYNQVFDLPYTIIRPSALYGPRCVSQRVGQIFIESALDDAKVRINGEGTERLDFTCIHDLVEGICLVLEKPASKNQIFNMTYGESRSINELVDVLRGHFHDLEVEYVERDELVPIRGTLDISKAQRLLGYEPKYPIEVGFADYVTWYKSLDATSGLALLTG